MSEKNLYYAWVGNDQGASTRVGGNGERFTSIREAENAARREFGSGWTVHVMRIWIDGDGKSWNNEYEDEVKTFRIR
jgi:hypothetical protein